MGFQPRMPVIPISCPRYYDTVMTLICSIKMNFMRISQRKGENFIGKTELGFRLDLEVKNILSEIPNLSHLLIKQLTIDRNDWF